MNSHPSDTYLVEDRHCGECTACCHYLPIDTHEFVKLPYLDCKNLLECGGCGIYSSRPKVCNDWYCAWRNMAHLDDDWRPDRMGVMLEFSQDNFPGEYAGKVGFRLTILDKTKIKSNAKLANFVGTQIHNKVPCIISYGTMVAELPTAGFLNYALAKAVGLRSEEGILYGITKAIEACEAQPKEMVKIVNGRLAPAED